MSTSGATIGEHEGDSRSEILRATHILELVVEAAEPGPWEPAGTGLERRIVRALFRLDHAWKGAVPGAAPGAGGGAGGGAGDLSAPSAESLRAEVTVGQARPAGPRFGAVPGAWSHVPIDTPGARVVAFCEATKSEEAGGGEGGGEGEGGGDGDGSGDGDTVKAGADPDPGSDPAAAGDERRVGPASLAALLEEPICRQAEDAATAVPDLELASRAGMPPLSLPQLLLETFDRRDSFGTLYARYVGVRLRELLFGNTVGFEILMRVLEDHQLAPRARAIVLTELYSWFLLLDPAPDAFVERLLSGTLRLLALPEAAPLRAPLLGTYLPNLLGIEGGAAPKPAAQIFEAKDEPRQRAAEALTGLSAAEGAARVVAWLRS